ncbi:hypothetical protein A2U01_0069041, partial [Trifolium medium]|nr:hypothetical protein [Trifolium medium]
GFSLLPIAVAGIELCPPTKFSVNHH